MDKFGDHRHCDIKNLEIVVGHVTPHVHELKVLCNFMGGNLYASKNPSLTAFYRVVRVWVLGNRVDRRCNFAAIFFGVVFTCLTPFFPG